MATFLRRAGYWLVVLLAVLASGFLIGAATGAYVPRSIAGYVVPGELALVAGVWRTANEGRSEFWMVLLGLQLFAMVAGAVYGVTSLRP